MNTEQLTQFPMGVITDADVKEHAAVSQPESTEFKTWTAILAASMIGTIAVCVIGAFYMSAALSPKMSRLESTKALILTWVSEEKGVQYIKDRTRPARP